MTTPLHLSWNPESGGLCLWAEDGRVEPDTVWTSALASHGQPLQVLAAVPEKGRIALSHRSAFCMSPAEAVAAMLELQLQSAPPEHQVWHDAARFAVELAVGQRVVPTVVAGAARWRAGLTRRADRERFDAILRAFPAWGRAIPTRIKPTPRFPSALTALRSFLDHAIDGWYRSATLPGPARAWVPEFAEALSGAQAAFTPKDARAHGVPELVASWAAEGEAAGLRVGFGLDAPQPNDPAPIFKVRAWIAPIEFPDRRAPVEDAWSAGGHVTLGGVKYPHPALAALRGLARAARVAPSLERMLEGGSPRTAEWTPADAWPFLKEGVAALRDAGFEVDVPPELDITGRQRLRGRLRLSAPLRPDGTVDLSQLLHGQWEIVLGDLAVPAPEFAALNALNQPVVPYRNQWVLLDPAEIARLPKGWAEGHSEQVPAADALRAILTGELNGVPVVADDHLALVIEALRNPPDQPAPTDLIATLRPYQERGFAWLAALGDLGLGALLADDMGLGKTVQLIAHLLRRRRTIPKGKAARPSLVVCPTSVLGNWQRELARFAPSLSVLSHHGVRRDVQELAHVDVVLTTYGLVVRDREELGSIQWDVVALDEAQAIKNPDSLRAKSARTLPARHRVCMSGTPVENRLDELWSLMDFLVPGLLGSRTRFQREVAVPIERFGDKERARQLKLGVAPFLLRRMKTDPTVISDLPEKIEKNEYTPLTSEQARLYRTTAEDYLERISGSEDIERRGLVLSMLTRLKQICNHPVQYEIAIDEAPDDPQRALPDRSGKLSRCEELVDAIVANDERCLIFTQYTEMGELLRGRLSGILEQDVPFLHGGTPQKRRDDMVSSFQEDPDAAPVLIVSLRAGGTGLNLTSASHVIHYDRWWNPAIEDQATDRAYRIGQRRDVQVHKLVCLGTLEERIDQRMNEKRQLAESVVGTGERWITELDDAALRLLVTLGDDALVEA